MRNASTTFGPQTVRARWSAAVMLGVVSLVLWSCAGAISDPPVPASYRLTIAMAGTGTGTVGSLPAGMTCAAGSCSGSYTSGQTVTLAATSATGSTFAGWSGSGCTGSGSCVVTVTGAATVTATFNLVPVTYALSVSLAGTGGGTVSSSPAGITCATGTCTSTYTSGQIVTLTAAPNAGSTFAGWSGGVCTGTSVCTLTMDAAKSVIATFNLTTFNLSVTIAGTGAGTVTSSPARINCSTGTCISSFTTGESVTLTAAASAGSIFAGWSGGVCTGTSVCTLTMDAAKSVTGTFTLSPPPGLTGSWQSPALQLPSINITFTAENAAAGSGVLGVAPTSPVQGPTDLKYTGDSFIITSGSNSASAVTFSGSLGANPVGDGTFYTGVISFSGTLNGGTLTGTLNWTPPRTLTQIFAAQTVAGLVLTKGQSSNFKLIALERSATTLKLQWDTIGAATLYTVDFFTGANFTTCAFPANHNDVQHVTGTTVTLSGLSASSLYQIHVHALPFNSATAALPSTNLILVSTLAAGAATQPVSAADYTSCQ